MSGSIIISDINDTNPVTICEELETLSIASGRRVCIFGDMPHQEDQWHSELGWFASGMDIDIIIVIGKYARNIFLGARGNKKARVDIEYFPAKEQFINDIDNLIFKGDTLLVKASPEMEIDKIVEQLMSTTTDEVRKCQNR
jgi:UDP-N-acetylmuramoyl-tripeptide--D-alanyl-D-alanine ligase